MAWWTAHNKPGKGADDVVFIREGFSWWALLFPLLWLAFKGMWIVLLLALAAQFLIWSVAEALGFSEFMRLVFSCAINLILAFEGNNLLRWTYERRGFTELGLVHGDDLDEAEYRFFSETALPEADDASEKVEPPRPPVLSSRWKAEEPDFIFPGFGRT
jgi:hypothetical protein